MRLDKELTRKVYGSTWVGETYYRQDRETAEGLQSSTDVVGDVARRGWQALVLYSLISFASSILLPWIIASVLDVSSSNKRISGASWLPGPLRTHRLDMPGAWGLSQLLFGATIILASFSRSYQFSLIVIALCGM